MKTVALAEISTQIRGVSYKKSDVRSSPADGYVPLLRGGNIGPHGLILDDLQYVPKSVVADRQMLQAGDIVVVASSGSKSVVGKAATAWSFDGTFGAFCKVIRPSLAVDPRYFAHFFTTPEYRREMSRLSEGANINNLKNEHLDQLLVQLPSKAEQRRIADILDKADALRAKRREAIAHLDSLGRSIFHEMFEANPYTPLGDLGVVQGGLQVTTKRDGHPLRRPYLRVANVFKGWIDTTSIKEMGVTPAEVERVSLQAGDLLFVEGHGNVEQVGRCAVWNEPCSNMLHQNHLIRYRPDTRKLLPDYVSMAVNTLPRGRSLQRRAKTTSGLNTITATDVRELSIPVAPLEEQIIFSARMAGIEKVKSLAVNELTQLDNLFLSLQDRGFNGEL